MHGDGYDHSRPCDSHFTPCIRGFVWIKYFLLKGSVAAQQKSRRHVRVLRVLRLSQCLALSSTSNWQPLTTSVVCWRPALGCSTRYEFCAIMASQRHLWVTYSVPQYIPAKLMYCAPAWAGFTSAANRARLDAFLRRCRRLGYCNQDTPAITELFDSADDTLFDSILKNSDYVIQPYTCQRGHNRSITWEPRRTINNLYLRRKN